VVEVEIMTRLGRKPQGTELVDSLAGSQHAKTRLKAFLETLSGEASVEEVTFLPKIGPGKVRES
jgi:hypothetical protein